MLSANGKLVFEFEVPVRWYDMDAFQHVNTSVYFTYFESTRIAWFNEITPAFFQIKTEGPVVVQTNCTFLKSVIYPETLNIKLYIGAVGRSSFETLYDVKSKDDPNILYAKGSAKIVWVDRNTSQSKPLPDELRQFLPEK